MSKKNELRPDQAITPDLYRTREAATEHSGHQPASKFSEQGSKPYDLDDVRNAPTRSGQKG